MRFDWDDRKAEANERKHGLRFSFAAAVFLDPELVDRADARTDYGEERRNVVGMIGDVCLVVTYTLRGDLVMIISARPASRRERAIYANRKADTR